MPTPRSGPNALQRLASLMGYNPEPVTLDLDSYPDDSYGYDEVVTYDDLIDADHQALLDEYEKGVNA